MTNGRLKSPDAVREFMLAGNATLTLQGIKDRFTYRIRVSDDGKVFFVAVMTGPDNETSYSYLGVIRKRGEEVEYSHGTKSKIGEDAPSAVAFKWFFWMLLDRKVMPGQLEVWHEGRCGRCGRKLTVPSSVERGIGPECAQYVGKQQAELPLA